jgi:predicted HTH domain antitoxin
MSLTLEIPDHIEHALRLPGADRVPQLRLELALALHARGILSAGKASDLAGVGRLEFGLLLGRRGLARHYGEADLAEDVKYASGE